MIRAMIMSVLIVFCMCLAYYLLTYLIIEITIWDPFNHFNTPNKRSVNKRRKEVKIINKIVDYYKYCKKCKYYKESENSEPCDNCLANPVNVNSQKPIRFEEKD